METRIVTHNVVHLRAKPTNDSELVSQTLMGRVLTLLQSEGSWSYVQSEDTYRGWAENRWLERVQLDRDADDAVRVSTAFADVLEEPRPDAPLLLRLPMLAEVVSNGSATHGYTPVMLPGGEGRGWILTAAHAPIQRPGIADRIPAYAAEVGRQFLGTPYLWGGSSSFGLDCSGFVQLCYRIAGIILRRDAGIQRDDERFIPIPVWDPKRAGEDLQPGDLVFFGRADKITHVGMHYEDNTFIHSAGGAGVILTQWGDVRYTPSYVDARRFNPLRAADPVVRHEAEI